MSKKKEYLLRTDGYEVRGSPGDIKGLCNLINNNIDVSTSVWDDKGELINVKDGLYRHHGTTLQEDCEAIIDREIEGLTPDETRNWFENTNNYSCATGAVGPLTYYVDAHRFAKKHYEEIIEIIENCGCKPKDSEFLNLNDLAWLGFELSVKGLKVKYLKRLEEEEK